MQQDLFEPRPRQRLDFAPGATLLPGAGLGCDSELLEALSRLEARAPFRHMVTPGGHRMSVAMTNCGEFGWVSDGNGYRYAGTDPATGQPWPAIPLAFLTLARSAATTAGYAGFEPDACLVNRYVAGAKMSLHQDRNERDFRHPIVSVSLGLPATFLFGGQARNDPTQKVALRHGDIVVWGGPSRTFFHGVKALSAGNHPVLGGHRINLTFRKVA